jgi:hypothetical protein
MIICMLDDDDGAVCQTESLLVTQGTYLDMFRPLW